MGIPCYFSLVVKNYPHVLQTWEEWKTQNQPPHHFMMDCNSLLYDAYHHQQQQQQQQEIWDETAIIQRVLDSMESHISLVGPMTTIYLALDGVAPVAKMKQQRERRHKAWICSPEKATKSLDHTKPGTFIFTPGTPFMNQLTAALHERFQHRRRFIVSGSDEAGEGEQKIFQWIRNHALKHERVCLYGLDADLIMLSLFHLSHVASIEIYRETPSFALKIDSPFLVLDIGHLAVAVEQEMRCREIDSLRIRRVFDYIVLCFLLGNDFLPHFPAINIRTTGITALMDTYRQCIGGNPQRSMVGWCTQTQKFVMHWPTIRLLFQQLAKHEQGWLQQEQNKRAAMSKTIQLGGGAAGGIGGNQDPWEHIPLLFRAQEAYISVPEEGWEGRYYHTLFPEGAEIRVVVEEYMRALEWVFYYYTTDCMNWRTMYSYSYAPLLRDIIHFTGKQYRGCNVHTENVGPVTTWTQLACVLPLGKMSESHIPEELKEIPRDGCGGDGGDGGNNLLSQMTWCYCRYLWEAHWKGNFEPWPHVEQWDSEFRQRGLR